MSKITLEFLIIDSKDIKRRITIKADEKEITLPHDIKRINLSPLSKIHRLEKIIIQSQYLDKIDLSPLSTCKNLRTLVLAGNALTDIDLAPLSHCENFQFLNLSSNPLVNLDMKPFENSRIKYIQLFHTKLEQLIITPLFSCTELEGLYVPTEVELIADISWSERYDIPPALQNITTRIKWVENEAAHIRFVTGERKDSDDDQFLSLESRKTKGIKIMRGCEIVGGKFDYKVKIQNDSKFVINNITIAVVAYPQDCMKIVGENSKTIARIEPSGFRSPQFTFLPTKDCVEGQIVSTVSYIDHENKLHLEPVEQYVIRSVCDLLVPLEQSPEVFEKLINNMDSTNDEYTIDWNPEILFLKAKKLLPVKNFHIIDSDSKIIGRQFTGTIRGFAEGKYTSKKVAIQVLISGSIEGNQSIVVIEAMGEDIAMVPATIEEISHGIESWICLKCGAGIDVDGVSKIRQNIPVACQYCQQTLTIDLYRK